MDSQGCCVVLHGNGQPAEDTAPRLSKGSDRTRHGGFTALSTAVTTGAVLTASFTTFFPGFIAFTVAAMLTSGVTLCSLGCLLTYRGAVRVSAVSESGVVRAAADYHRREYGPRERP